MTAYSTLGENLLNIWGWLFFLASFGVFYAAWLNTRYSKLVLFAGLLGIAIHHVLSILNVVYGPFFFTQFDAFFFHDYADNKVNYLDTLQWGLGSELYRSSLTIVYLILGQSLWLGQSISILFYALALGCLLKLSEKMALTDLTIILTLMLFSVIPSSLMFGCFTLRETFFTYFLIAGTYASYKAIFDPMDERWRFFLIAAAHFLLMGIFHLILLFYGVLLTGCLLLILWVVQGGSLKTLAVVAMGLIAVLLVLIKFPELLPVSIGDNYFAMLDVRIYGRQLSIPEAISLYHQSTNESQASTQYTADLRFSTWIGMAGAMLMSYVFYLGWPFLGPYNDITTYVILSEALIRLAGILAMIMLAYRDRRWCWLLFIYFSLTFTWNIGTTNHGQALRHHFMSEWLPIMALLFWLQSKSLLHFKFKSAG